MFTMLLTLSLTDVSLAGHCSGVVMMKNQTHAQRIHMGKKLHLVVKSLATDKKAR